MIIIHENLQAEAEKIAETLKKVYCVNSKIICWNLHGLLPEILQFNGFYPASYKLLDSLPKNKFALILTDRDLYADKKSREDDWVFGSCFENAAIASAARMKRKDNLPSRELKIDFDLYMKRMEALRIQEIGHDVVREKAEHYKSAEWINARTGHRLELGPIARTANA